MAGRIPAALRARLEDEATFGLIEVLESERRDWSEQVFGMASDRFERRLAQELGLLRTDVSKALNDGLSAIRQGTAPGRIETAEVGVRLLDRAGGRDRRPARIHAALGLLDRPERTVGPGGPEVRVDPLHHVRMRGRHVVLFAGIGLEIVELQGGVLREAYRLPRAHPYRLLEPALVKFPVHELVSR